MPDQLTASVKRAEVTLRRADQELEKLRSDLSLHARFVGDRSTLSAQFATTANAQANLAKLSKMAVKLEGAYTNSSLTLREYAASSDDLRTINAWLSFFYLAMAVSKVMDLIASVTGTGKLITNAKTAVTDMVDVEAQMKVERAEKGRVSDETQAKAAAIDAARGIDLPLIALRWTELIVGVDQVESSLAAIVEIVKDLVAILHAKKDLDRVKTDLGLWVITVGEKIVRLEDCVGKTVKLYESWMGLKKIWDTKGFGKGGLFQFKPFEVAKPYEMRMSDYFSAVKYGIEALLNLAKMVRSIMDTAESWKAGAAAREQADRQLAGDGSGGIIAIDLAAFAGMTQGDLVKALYSLNSAPDARQLALDTGMRAQCLAREVDRMKLLYQSMSAGMAPLTAQLKESITRIQSTDRELEQLRQELARQRDAGRLRVAVALDLIDRERKLIAASLGSN